MCPAKLITSIWSIFGNIPRHTHPSDGDQPFLLEDPPVTQTYGMRL